MVRRLLLSSQFRDPGNYYKRYSWPVEFVVRAIKEVGWTGFSVNDALTPLVNMGQQLLEPPDVNGWDLGRGWFTSGAMLARMNFAAQLATNQKFNLRDAFRGHAGTPDALRRARARPALAAAIHGRSRAALARLRQRAAAHGPDPTRSWPPRASGIVHLIVGSGEYQFV